MVDRRFYTHTIPTCSAPAGRSVKKVALGGHGHGILGRSGSTPRGAVRVAMERARGGRVAASQCKARQRPQGSALFASTEWKHADFGKKRRFPCHHRLSVLPEDRTWQRVWALGVHVGTESMISDQREWRWWDTERLWSSDPIQCCLPLVQCVSAQQSTKGFGNGRATLSEQRGCEAPLRVDHSLWL